MDQQYLLTDEQMRQFITEGYLILRTDFSESFHENLCRQLKDVYEKEGNPGNNILPRIPALHNVFDHPTVRGALSSVLGPDYIMHPHRHGHYNANPKAGGWHKDSYWGYEKTRNHRPWWAMIFYYPQDVPIELGPTGVLPGTSNYEDRYFAEDDIKEEVKATGEAGTFVLVRYDIWHRANANISGLDRFMLKFQFVRTSVPDRPTWNNQTAEWRAPESYTRPIFSHDVQWEDTWRWLRGEQVDIAAHAFHADTATSVDTLIAQLQSHDESERVHAANELGKQSAPNQEVVHALTKALHDDFEPVRLNASYGLARQGEDGMKTLLHALEDEYVLSRTAAYGLSAVGEKAIDGLLHALNSDNDDAVAHAAFALGEIGQQADQVVANLAKHIQHDSTYVRRNVSEAIGQIGVSNSEALEALTSALQDEDAQVRFNTGLALTRLGEQAEAAVPSLVQALEDEDRYVRANAAEALFRIGTDQARDALLQFLRGARWCPSTTPQSTF